ncbi:MAG TPA: site-specific integrase [Gaiellaceae bacterium]|jgi:integrase
MPRGAAVIEYRGKRGTTWRIKYADADGKQAMETIGAERDGVTRKQAEAELRERLVRVERKAYRRPKALTFAEYRATWFEEGKRRRGWKPRTVLTFRTTLDHLEAFFGPQPLGAIRPRDVAAYTRDALESKRNSGKPFAPKTVQLHLNVLHDVFKTALREELVDSNPVAGAERPKVPARRWRILEPAEIGRVLKAFTDEQARAIFLTVVLTGLRRFELKALRWRDVALVEGVLRVRVSKSEEGERLIALSPTLVDALSEHWRRSAFQGDDELVFCHPERGSMIDDVWWAARFREALKAAGITDHVRPWHDLRHTAITNDAAAGSSELAVMSKAGHRSMSTTKTYLHLAGVVFRDEADALERRLLGGPGVRRPEPNVVVDRVGRGLGDGEYDEDPAEPVLDDVVGDELTVRDVGEAEVSPARALDDADGVAKQDAHG